MMDGRWIGGSAHMGVAPLPGLERVHAMYLLPVMSQHDVVASIPIPSSMVYAGWLFLREGGMLS